MRLTPHQKIMRAADRGVGLRLTAEEVGALSRDGAIEQCAANDDEDMEFCRHCGAGIGAFRRDGEGTCPKCDETISADKI
jgi:hypothetical protein